MNKQKTITSLLFILIIGLLSLFFGKDYLDFQEKTSENTKSIEFTKKSAKDFKISDIKKLEKAEVFYTPYTELLEKIVSKINTAEKKVYLEVYMFTEKRIKNAIINAKKRDLDVKVILEKNPYMTANINNKTFEELQKAGVETVWSNTKNYSLNHSKFFVIDDEVIISTGNMTYSTFKHNRDFFVFLDDKNILKKVEQIFLNDFNGKKAEVYDENLLVSPNYSRTKIEKLLQSAQKEVKIYMQYLKDDEINNTLKKIKNKGIDVKIIINKKNETDEEIPNLKGKGIQIKSLGKPKMHSKVIIIDEKIIFIGSQNFSSYSLDKNREMGIILDDESIIKKVVEVFEKDWE